MTSSESEHGSNGLNELDRCHTCGHNRLWHDNNSPLHPFNDGSAGARAFLGSKRDRDTPARPSNVQRGTERPSWPIDPVLRQALINREVITPQDLRDAEEQIRAVTAQFEATVKESRQ
jgi:hypothetical protein